MDDMLFGFPDPQTRNAAGRAVRKAGYECHGTGPDTIGGACALHVTATTTPGRAAVVALVRAHAPTASLVS